MKYGAVNCKCGGTVINDCGRIMYWGDAPEVLLCNSCLRKYDADYAYSARIKGDDTVLNYHDYQNFKNLKKKK
jgi:hypothetical protein